MSLTFEDQQRERELDAVTRQLKSVGLSETGSVEKKLLALIEQERRKNPSLQYHEALKLVARENPDLVQRYLDANFSGLDEGLTEAVKKAQKALLDAVDQKIREDPGLPYHEALKLAASENPDLARRCRNAAFGGRD